MWKANIFLHVVSQVWMSEGFRGLFSNSLIAQSQPIAEGFPFVSSWIWIIQDSLGFPGLILKSFGRDGAGRYPRELPWAGELCVLVPPQPPGAPSSTKAQHHQLGLCLELPSPSERGWQGEGGAGGSQDLGNKSLLCPGPVSAPAAGLGSVQSMTQGNEQILGPHPLPSCGGPGSKPSHWGTSRTLGGPSAASPLPAWDVAAGAAGGGLELC